MKFRKLHKPDADPKVTVAEQVEALIGCIICGLTMYISAHGFTKMLVN